MKSDKKKLGGFGAIIEMERKQMIPLNFVMAYRVAPTYLALSFLLIAGFSILMGIDEDRYYIPAMVLLGAVAVLSVALLASLPFVRKKAIASELARYCFDTTDITVDRKLNVDGRHLCFNRDSVQIDDKVFDYSDLCCRIVTNNYCKRINVAVWICPPADEDGILLPLSAYTLKLLECFPFVIENAELLAYIINHKENALRQIYDKGYVKLPQ